LLKNAGFEREENYCVRFLEDWNPKPVSKIAMRNYGGKILRTAKAME
jgi:hypothetical protein